MKNATKVLISLVLLLLLIGCSSNKEMEIETLKNSLIAAESEIEKLKENNTLLSKQVDDLENGAPRLFEKAKKAFNEKDVTTLASLEQTISQKHGGSNEQLETSKLLIELKESIKKEEENAKKKKEAEILEEKKRKEIALNNLRKNTDEVREMSFYRDKSSSEYVNENAFYLYIGKDEKTDATWLNFRIQYNGDNWIFIDKYTIKTDNDTYTITPSYSEITRDNDYGEVWEYYDSNVSESTQKMIEDIINSEKTIIRHQGRERHFDYTVKSSEKKALQTMLDAFSAFNE